MGPRSSEQLQAQLFKSIGNDGQLLHKDLDTPWRKQIVLLNGYV